MEKTRPASTGRGCTEKMGRGKWPQGSLPTACKWAWPEKNIWGTGCDFLGLGPILVLDSKYQAIHVYMLLNYMSYPYMYMSCYIWHIYVKYIMYTKFYVLGKCISQSNEPNTKGMAQNSINIMTTRETITDHYRLYISYSTHIQRFVGTLYHP